MPCVPTLAQGVGHIAIVDADAVDPTNINRQLPALHSTVGRPKVEVLAERLWDINPSLRLVSRQVRGRGEAA
jgi:tRNA A37 threonylcarbamoyladenosine dehydratase